ncbi:MAG TPA: cyclic nucleotide-binding domain-containing protein [Acidimicrobiales bacterium]
MVRNSKVDSLQDVPLFSSCTVKELTQIARAADEVTVAEGTAVVTEGTLGHEFYLILEGRAAVSRAGQPVAELGPGQYFGEMSLLDGAPRNATVTAVGSTSLLVLGQREFAAVLDSSPGVARKLLTHMAARLRAADEMAVTH